MATVTSFSEFLTAIAGSEDIVLANDIDAQAEGYDVITSILDYGNNKINGDGHKISNVTISNTQIAFSGSSTIRDVIFDNILYRPNANGTLFAAGTNYVTLIKNCKITAMAGTNGYDFNITRNRSASSAGYGPHVVDSALDITISNKNASSFIYSSSSPLYGPNCTFTRCNMIVRNADINASSSYNIVNFSGLTSTAFVLHRCRICKSAMGFSNSGGYIALKDCIAENGDSITISGSGNSNYFCNDSNLNCTVSNAQSLTPEQLKSESYLRSIGFLP